VTGAISTSAVSASGVPRHASAGLITTGAAHGLLAGDTVVLSGHSVNEVNGTHRIFDVPSSTQFRIPIALSGAGTGGTWAKLAMLTTPALCIREFLTNRVYGPAADESTEIDDTAWNAEATYHETATGIPVANSPTFQNRKGVSQIVVSGGVAVATTTTIPSDGSTPATTTHQFTVGQTARISGFSTSASGALNGSFPITAVTTNTFSFATAVANGTYFCDTSTVRTPRTRDELSVTTYMGRVIVTTPGTLFACNGLADPSQSIQATLEELLSSCRGLLVYQSGKFRLVTPRATTPLSTFALTDDTIVGDVTVTCPGQDDAANVVVATFPNIASNFQQDTVSFPAAIDPNDLLAGDNNLWLRKEINLPFTTNRATAQQIAMVLRRESRARVLQCVATEAALLAQVGDVVPVTRDVYGWSAKPFRVLVMAARQDDTVELTLVEHDDTWYNLDPNDDVTYYNNTPPTSHYPAATRITLVDFRKLGLSAHGGSGSLASGLSLGYTILNSANANITVSAHTVNVPTGNQTYLAISYPSANVFVSGSAAPKRGSPWYVYMDDPNVDGSGSYAATQTPPDLAQSATRRYIGSVTIPAGNTGTDATAGVDGSTKRY
ncbi:MAG: hypothetical protein HOQ12_01770, partial [Gemmatimonadaceae bacterium]|nr:hypothetical protein [Gemmatimonadaceae bacterium]